MASVEDVIKYIIQLFCPDTGWLPLLRVDVILDKLNFELFHTKPMKNLQPYFKQRKQIRILQNLPVLQQEVP